MNLMRSSLHAILGTPFTRNVCFTTNYVQLWPDGRIGFTTFQKIEYYCLDSVLHDFTYVLPLLLQMFPFIVCLDLIYVFFELRDSQIGIKCGLPLRFLLTTGVRWIDHLCIATRGTLFIRVWCSLQFLNRFWCECWWLFETPTSRWIPRLYSSALWLPLFMFQWCFIFLEHYQQASR